MANEIKRLSDILPSFLAPDLPRVELDDLLDLDITVEEVRFFQGNFGEFVVVIFSHPKYDRAFFTTGAGVILKKLRAVQDQLPLIASIRKVRSRSGRRYYDIV